MSIDVDIVVHIHQFRDGDADWLGCRGDQALMQVDPIFISTSLSYIGECSKLGGCLCLGAA